MPPTYSDNTATKKYKKTSEKAVNRLKKQLCL